MKAILWSAGIVNALCVIILVLFTGIQSAAFGTWFYEIEYDKNGTYAQISVTPDELSKVTKHLIRYMQGKEEELNIETVVNGQTRMFYSEIELFHMNDVKNLFTIGFIIRNIVVILFIISLAMLVFAKKDWKYILFTCWHRAAGSIFALLMILAALIAANFDRAFTVFHEIFFTNDMWQLDANVDLLVNIVPTPFFIDIAIYVGAFFGLGLVLIFIIGIMISGRAKRA